jgi:hypothetical protein
VVFFAIVHGFYFDGRPGLASVSAFVENYYYLQGNFNVPKKHGARLNSFVTNIRKAMRRKSEGLFQKELTEERIDRLKSINFTWEPKNPNRQRSSAGGGETLQYDYLYDLLADFKEHYGHVHVAKMMPIWRNGSEGPPKPEYKRLTQFIASVRNEHELFLEGKTCALDAEKVRRLTELGVKWKRPGEFGRESVGLRDVHDFSQKRLCPFNRTDLIPEICFSFAQHQNHGRIVGLNGKRARTTRMTMITTTLQRRRTMHNK